MPIIEVEHVTKEFKLGQLRTLKHNVSNAFRRLRGEAVERPTAFKALDDVSFTVEEGEVVGIIGHNGAGKSTLLKLLSRITVPTSGRVAVKGKVAPLIEVGAGLIGDMTGRENIYLNGAILGMSQRELRKKFDEIVAFAELERFIDTPLKRYSSGMQVRLGFAVATSVEADVLIVDEVLAVGDMAFQRKCFDRMERLIKGMGKTVLLVSHNIRQVERMSTRAMLLSGGRIAAMGDTRHVCNLFFEQSDEKILADAVQVSKTDPGSRIQTTGQASIMDLRLVDGAGRAVEAVHTHDDVSIELTFEARETLRHPVFAAGIHTPDFLYVATQRSSSANLPQRIEPGRYTVTCRIEDLPLLPGVYALRASMVQGEIGSPVFDGENLWHFRVIGPEIERAAISSEGLITLSASWQISTPAKELLEAAG